MSEIRGKGNGEGIEGHLNRRCDLCRQVPGNDFLVTYNSNGTLRPYTYIDG